MDSGIKLLIVLVLGVVPFFIDGYVNYFLLLSYLAIATLMARIQLKVLIKNIAAYVAIIIFPYAMGIFIAVSISKLTGNGLVALQGSLADVSLRLFQLFILWYVGILYLNSTKVEQVLGLFDKLLAPLKSIGLPVTDFLKVILCVINELKELAPEAKRTFFEGVSHLAGQRKSLSQSRLRGISQVIAGYIVNSFARLDQLEEHVKRIEKEDVFNYRFNFSKTDFFALLSLILLIGIMIYV